MTITTLRPGSDTYLGSVTPTGGPSTAWQCVNDASINDATYITAANSVGYPKAVVRMKVVAGGLSGVGAAQRILRVRAIARMRMNATSSGQAGTLLLAERSPAGSYDFTETMQYADAVNWTNRFGVWRTQPPSGYGSEWTVSAIEAVSTEVRFQPSAFTGINLRVSEMYLDVDIRDQSTVTAISISNPSLSTQPTVTWQFNSNFDGDPQTAYQVKIFSSQQYTQPTFNPATSQAVWDSGVSYSNAAQITVGRKLENGQTYGAWVRVAADFGGQKWWSNWANSSPSTIILTPLPVPVMIGLTPDPVNFRNLIQVQNNLNNLEVQDADFNSAFFGTGTWSAFFGGGTLTRVTSPVAEGAASMQAQKNGSAGDLDLLTKGGTTGFRVKPGVQYWALASLRTASVARNAQVGISWYDRTGASISITLGTAVTLSTSGWIQAVYTGTAPAGAVYAAEWVKVISAGASEIFYVDKAHVGTNVLVGSGTVAGTSGTSQPQVAAKYDSGYWDSPSVVIACANIPPLSALVAITLSGRSASTTTNVVTSTGGLTWTNQRENGTANTGDASVSTAYFAAGGSINVTVTGNQGDARTLVYAVTGHDEASFGGATNVAAATSGAGSVNLTTSRENSLVLVGVGDFNEVNPRTRVWRKPGGQFTEDFVGDFGEGVTYFAHYIMPTAGAATHGLTAPTGMAYGAVAVEIRGASFNTTQTVYTGWTRGGWVGSVSTVVERALVSTGNRNNAHPQLWSGGDWYQSTDGFYLPTGQAESSLAYDVLQAYQGLGSIRWNVNNVASVLYMGWEDGPRLIGEPQEPLLGIEGHAYTFSLQAKATTTFATKLTLQALDQFGSPVGSPQDSGSVNIGTSWTLVQASLSMPFGCLWVRASLENSGSVTEQRVWVDDLQWVEGQTVDTPAAFGAGVAVDWKPIRNADRGEFLITDGEAGLIGSIWDTEAPPGYGVVYRAYNYLPATATVPALGSPITFYATSRLAPPGPGFWLLRDPQDAALAVRIRVTDMDENQHEESQTYYPLRPTTWDQLGQRAVTITDFIGGYDGSLKVSCDTEAEWAILRQLMSRPRPMWLIFPDFGARYVRITSRSWKRDTAKTRTSWTDPDAWRRDISLEFLESDAP
jgi:hypothetical protein